MENVIVTLRYIFSLVLITVFVADCRDSNNKKIIQTVMTKNYFDSNDHVFKKLYKKDSASILYWETWNADDKKAIIHWGHVGNLGEQTNLSTSVHSELKDKINTLITNKINEGYSEIPASEQFTIAVIFKLRTWGTPKDLDRREEIRNILTEHLGWTGNGHCGDGDIGSGEMTLYADVIDPYLAIKTIPKEFKTKNITEEYYFEITQGDKVIAQKITPNKE